MIYQATENDLNANPQKLISVYEYLTEKSGGADGRELTAEEYNQAVDEYGEKYRNLAITTRSPKNQKEYEAHKEEWDGVVANFPRKTIASTTDKAVDLAKSFGSGAISAVSDVLNVVPDSISDNGSKDFLDDTAKNLTNSMTADSQIIERNNQKLRKQASENGSIFDVISAGISTLTANNVFSGFGSIAPTVGAALLTGGTSTAAQVASKVVPYALGGAMGVGGLRSNVNQKVYNDAIEAGNTEAEAKRIASVADDYDSIPAYQTALAGAGGAIGGVLGAEKIANQALLKMGTSNIVKRVAKKGLEEATEEVLQTGQSSIAANQASIAQGLSDKGLFNGVLMDTVQAGLTGFLTGGVFGVKKGNDIYLGDVQKQLDSQNELDKETQKEIQSIVKNTGIKQLIADTSIDDSADTNLKFARELALSIDDANDNRYTKVNDSNDINDSQKTDDVADTDALEPVTDVNNQSVTEQVTDATNTETEQPNNVDLNANDAVSNADVNTTQEDTQEETVNNTVESNVNDKKALFTDEILDNLDTEINNKVVENYNKNKSYGTVATFNPGETGNKPKTEAINRAITEIKDTGYKINTGTAQIWADEHWNSYVDYLDKTNQKSSANKEKFINGTVDNILATEKLNFKKAYYKDDISEVRANSRIDYLNQYEQGWKSLSRQDLGDRGTLTEYQYLNKKNKAFKNNQKTTKNANPTIINKLPIQASGLTIEPNFKPENNKISFKKSGVQNVIATDKITQSQKEATNAGKQLNNDLKELSNQVILNKKTPIIFDDFNDTIDLLVLEYGAETAGFILSQIEEKLGKNISRLLIIKELENAINSKYTPSRNIQAPASNTSSDTDATEKRTATADTTEQRTTETKTEQVAEINLTKAQEIEKKETRVIQNRNRSSQASIAQMQKIAANPDFLRAGISNTMQDGAPIVDAIGDEFPAGAIVGEKDVAVDADGKEYSVQYAVVEADNVLTSNEADGKPVDGYAEGKQGMVRAIAGNGRAAGIKQGYLQGNAKQYKEMLATRSSKVGINSADFEGMKQPVLIRLMPQSQVTDDIGDVSNVPQTAPLNPVDQAKTDAASLDLDSIDFDENGVTNESVGKWVYSLKGTQSSGLLGDKGEVSKQAISRLSNAIFYKAYGSDELVKLYGESTDPEIVRVINAIGSAAPFMAQLEGTGDYDIRGAVVEAAQIAVNAKRKGEKLSDYLKTVGFTESGEGVAIALFFAENYSSGKSMKEGLINLAQTAIDASNLTEQNKTQGGFFEPVIPQTRENIFKGLGNAEQANAITKRNEQRAVNLDNSDVKQKTDDTLLKNDTKENEPVNSKELEKTWLFILTKAQENLAKEYAVGNLDITNLINEHNQNLDDLITIEALKEKAIKIYNKDYNFLGNDFDRLPIDSNIDKGNTGNRVVYLPKNKIKKGYYASIKNDYVLKLENSFLDLSVLTKDNAIELSKAKTGVNQYFDVVPRVYAEHMGYEKVADKDNLMSFTKNEPKPVKVVAPVTNEQQPKAEGEVEATAKILKGKNPEKLISLFDVLGEVRSSEFNKQQAIDVIDMEIKLLPEDIRLTNDKERKLQLKERLNYLSDVKNKEKEIELLFKDLEKDDSEKLADANKKVAKAYHKAKEDGSNPELVKAVEQLLKEQPKAEAGKEVESKDFAFSNFSRGSIPYEKNEIASKLKNNERSEYINVLGYHEFQDLLNKIDKKKPKDIVGNHAIDRPNAVVVNENGDVVVKMIDKDTSKIGDNVFYKFKSLEKAAETLHSIKENHRFLQLSVLAGMEARGKETELTKYANPTVVKNTLEKLGIEVPQSIKDKISEQSIKEQPKAVAPLVSKNDGGNSVGGDNPALKDETPILVTPKKLSSKGLQDLDIVNSKEANEALEAEIGSDKGVIDENVRTIPIQEYDVPSNRRSKQIAEQIEENGWVEPLIVSYDKNGNVYIVEGQHRAAALKELGYDKAPVIVIHEKDLGKQSIKEQPKAVADNKTQDLILTQQTADEARQAILDKEAEDKERSKADAKIEAKRKAEQKAKEVKQALATSADSFTLGGSIENELSGQNDIFKSLSTNNNKPSTVANLRSAIEEVYGNVGDTDKKLKKVFLHETFSDLPVELQKRLNNDSNNVVRGVETQKIIDSANYVLRRKDGVLLRLPIDFVLDNQESDFKVERGRNEIGNRIDYARNFLKSAPKDLEASVIYLKNSGENKGKISFEDGRHRLIAAKELGATHAYFELSETKEQLDSLKRLASEFENKNNDTSIQNSVTPFDGIEKAVTPIGNTQTVTVGGKEYSVFNSDGKPIHPTIEGVRNFVRWFGDSLVTDNGKTMAQGGKPMVVYHGSKENIKIFDKNKINKNNGMENGFGFYFSANKEFSQNFGSVNEYYLQIKNTFIVNDDKSFTVEVENQIGFTDKQYAKFQKIRSKSYEREIATYIVRENGYDGIIANKKINEVVVFNPNQIKSATGNNGDFDIDNNSILKSKNESTAQAFYDPASGGIHLIADRINAGEEQAVFLHEIMHKQELNLLGKENLNLLYNAVQDWKTKPADTIERQVYEDANRRATNSENYNGEFLNYAIEETAKRGIKPDITAPKGSIANWFAQVFDAFNRALNKLLTGARVKNKNIDFTVQDLMAMAYGAAGLEYKAGDTDVQLNYNDEGQHLAPNGKVSKLTEQQAKTVRTEAFKNWFGDWENDPENASKVVDENGEPLVVYHGTENSGFTIFGLNGYSEIQTEKGFWFSDFDRASGYANSNRNVKITPNFKSWSSVEKYAASMGVSFYKASDDYEEGSYFLGDVIIDSYNEAQNILQNTIKEKELAGVYPVFLKINNLKVIDGKNKKGVNVNVNVELLKKQKFNGIVINNVDDPSKNDNFGYLTSNYVAFSSNQIKLADGTNTTFDDNNDIRFSKKDDLIKKGVNALNLGNVNKPSDERPSFEATERIAKSGTVQQKVSSIKEIKDKTVTALTDSTRPHDVWATDNLTDDEALPLIRAKNLAAGREAAFNKEVLIEFGDAISRATKSIVNNSKLRNKPLTFEAALRLGGEYMSAIYAPIANQNLLKKDKELLKDAEVKQKDNLQQLLSIEKDIEEVKSLLSDGNRTLKQVDYIAMLQRKQVRLVNLIDSNTLEPNEKLEAELFQLEEDIKDARKEFSSTTNTSKNRSLLVSLEREFKKVSKKETEFNRLVNTLTKNFNDRKKAIENDRVIDPTKEDLEAPLAGGLNNASAKHLMGIIEKTIPKRLLENLANEVYKMNKWKLQKDIEMGKVTQEIADKFDKSGKYVPLTGDPSLDDSGGKSFESTKPNVSKDYKLQGKKTSLAIDGISASFEQIQKSAKYHAWNDYKDALHSTYENRLNNYINNGKTKSEAEDAVFNDIGISRNSNEQFASYDGITYRKNGEFYSYDLGNIGAIEALRSTNVEDIPSAIRYIAQGTRVMSRLVTQLMFGFAPTNSTRDVWEKSENIRARKYKNVDMNKVANDMLKISLAQAKSIHKDISPVVSKGTWLSGKFKIDPKNENQKLLMQFANDGGLSTFGDFISTDGVDLSKKLAGMNPAFKTTNAIFKTFNTKTPKIIDNISESLDEKLSKTMDAVAVWNDSFEIVSSLSAYKALLKNGVPSKDAAELALELMNFRKGGTRVKPIKAVYMFAQPIATGGHQLVKTLSTPVGQKRFLAYMLGGMALYALLRSGEDDEETGLNRMDETSNFQTERNIVIPIGNGNTVNIPIGFGLPMLAWGYAVNLDKMLLGRQTAAETVAELAKLHVKTFAPVAPSETSISAQPTVWFAQTVTPTLFKPVINVSLDRTFAGAPLTSARFEKPDNANALEGKASTADFYKDIAKQMANFGFDVYPEQVKEVLKGYGVGLFSEILKATVDNPAKESNGIKTANFMFDRIIKKQDNKELVNKTYYRIREELNDVGVKNSLNLELSTYENRKLKMLIDTKEKEASFRGKKSAITKAFNKNNNQLLFDNSVKELEKEIYSFRKGLILRNSTIEALN